MPPPTGGPVRRSPAEAHAAIESLLGASRQPALFEPGEERFLLTPGRYAIVWSDSQLTVEVWDDERHLVRRVLALGSVRPGRVELIVERFPRRRGRLYLVDLDRPAAAGVAASEKRLCFRERLRRMLSREFPAWTIVQLSSAPDLEHSLSGTVTRGLLVRSGRGLAVVGAPPGGAVDQALSFGLIWLDYLRRRKKWAAVEGLALFLPQGQERTTCLRLRWLDPDAARWSVFVYSPEGHVAAVDLADRGNVETWLEPCLDAAAALSGRVAEWCGRLAALPEVERINTAAGAVTLRVHGLEFARAAGGRLEFGLARRAVADEASLREAEAMARELARMRRSDAADRGGALWRMQPERWMESQLRAGLEDLDASLLPAPVYDQVPAVAAGERGVLDLLAAERGGRLVVIEVKAGEDLHLPVQALDYWLRVRWHLDRGEFSAQGYFPGIELRREPPRLLLVAPALDFHPTTGAILRFFSPEVPVECIGVGLEWRSKLRVAFRTDRFDGAA